MTEIYTELLQENSELEAKIFRLEQENNSLQAQLNNITVQSNNAITALEQENKELKNIIKIHDSTKYDYYKLMKENEEWHIKYAGCNTANNAIQEENKKYRSALEEINRVVKLAHKVEDYLLGQDYTDLVDRIEKEINEVLNGI